MKHHVGIIGAGTMGAGIAQVAAASGWHVHLLDVDASTVESAIDGIRKRFARQVEKDRMTPSEEASASARLMVASKPEDLSPCHLVIEAIVEDLEIKTTVLRGIVPHLGDDAIIATNTSSLSVTALGEAIDEPARTVGMHFFNPAPLMKLVEVIAGAGTDAAVVDRVAAIAIEWHKEVARAADVPGFIVNHVARPYYLEAFRVLEDGFATPSEIDSVMKTLGGFRMGPLELTDLIGQDVNTATTRSVWEQIGHPPLLRPSALQESLVEQGTLGRKTGAGVYDYSGDEPRTLIDLEVRDPELSADLVSCVERFVDATAHEAAEPRLMFVYARILVAIMTQGMLAYERGVASKNDIDTALKFGVNYPRGPFQWGSVVGEELWVELLTHLNGMVEDGRFAVPEALAASV